LGDKAKNLAWTTFGRYALLDKIGSGGMAEIYRAKTFGAAGFEKEFAIKLILPSLVDDTEFVEMFINEAKIAVSLYHANIVQVFDLGEIDGQYYIAMEFVHGMDLLDILARCANLDLKIPLDLVLFITMEALKGLDFAHRAKDAYGEDLNIIHRDVSPSNVMISYAGDVKIGDFGVAKAAIQRNLTETGTLKGKVGYMSPEQVVGDKIDWRSDIFSAGIVFFEALSMSRLFVGNSDLDVMLRVRDADIEESLEKTGPIPTQLEHIIRRALSKHREERFQTAGEFYQALVDFCYQHRIKVSGQHLSNFMRRLFAEEIEAEKNRRLSDMDGREAALAAQASEVEVAPPPSSPSAPSTPSHGNIKVSTEEHESDGDSGYRYRDPAGLIYGPMGQETLVKMLSERTREDGEQVSFEGNPWVPLEQDEEIAGRLGIRTEVEQADTEPEERARMDRVRALQNAASALEEISLAAESSFSETQLDEHSAPIATETPPEPEPYEPVRESAQHKAIEALRDQYAAFEGNFEESTFARLLTRLHWSKATGRLYVTSNEIEKSIFFDQGEPILVDSNREDELLGFFLLSRRVITQEQLEEGLARLSEWGGRLGDALVAIGAIPAHEIFQHLSAQMREKILQVFTWTEGDWGYFENQQPETHGYPLGIDAYGTIVEGCLERIPLSEIREYYEPRLTVPVHRRSDALVSLDELRLSSKALRIVKSFQPGDSIEKLKDRLPAESANFVYRVVYLLHQVQILTFEDTREVALPGG
jgi:serine/threonine protein kinase